MATISKQRRDKWLKLVRALQREVPIGRPVHVKTRTLKAHEGLSWYFTDRKEFLLTVGSHLTWQRRVEYLLHEYAHLHDWFTRYQRLMLMGEAIAEWVDKKRVQVEVNHDHGPTWGLSYAACYQVWERLKDAGEI